MRLDRLLTERGAGSRKDARRMLRRKLVQVNGELAHRPEQHVDEDAVITVADVPLPPLPVLLAWHKPEGVVSTTRDPWGRRTLAEALPEAWRTRFHPVGRLDAETTGLLLFSRDGALTQHLLHPKRAVEREYLATVSPAADDTLAPRLAAGIETGEGMVTAEVVAVEADTVRLIVREGKHRMVRRMLNNAGHPVTALRRMRFGGVVLGELAEGEHRPVSAEELGIST